MSEDNAISEGFCSTNNGAEGVSDIPEPNGGIFNFVITREELRKKREELHNITDSRFVKEMVGVMRRLVLDTNERGKKSYTYHYVLDDIEKKDLLSEIQKRVADMFVDSVVTLDVNFLPYVKIKVDWNEDKN